MCPENQEMTLQDIYLSIYIYIYTHVLSSQTLNPKIEIAGQSAASHRSTVGARSLPGGLRASLEAGEVI